MIISFIMGVIIFIATTAIGTLPQVTSLPFNIDQFVLNASTYVYAFTAVFWPLQPIVVCFVLYVSLKVLLIPLRFFLGSRAPQVYPEI